MTDYPARQRDLLRVKSLNSRHAMAENVRVWEAYVDTEINRMLDAGVSPLYRRSWMLRKGVRAHVPDATLQRLYADPTLPPDPNAQDAEAIRYAVIEGMPETFVAQQPAASGTLAVTAALCGKWKLAADSATLYAGRTPLDASRVGDLLRHLGMPAALVPAWVPAEEQPARTRKWWLHKMWTDIISYDDADNYLLFDSLDVTKDDGQEISADKARTAISMHEWLHESERNSYVSGLGQVLVSRFKGFAVLGAGSYGLVLQATRNNVRYAIKLTMLGSPVGDDNPEIVELQRSEMELLRIVSRANSNMRRATRVFPWLIDWTRGRMDASAAFHSLSTPKTRSKLLRGQGVYLTIVMPLFDFTLLDWLDAAERAGGTNAQAYLAFVPMLMAIVLALLAQLVVLGHDLIGFQHNDIKGNNVLMQRMPNAVQEDDFITLRHVPDTGLASGASRRFFSLRPSDTGGYAVTLSDLGMAGSRMPRLGHETRRTHDLQQLAAMVPSWDYGPGASSMELKAAISNAADRGLSPLALLQTFGPARRFFS